MNNSKIILALDTSNYTTSAALMHLDGELVANIKRPLPVKLGECGLRQSDAVFAHIKNLPEIMEEVRDKLNGRAPSFVGVSTRPRNLEGSYMPCFLSGVAAAESIAASLGVPLYKYSHQCGHIMAAIYSARRYDLLDGREFCAFHVSGGTTEVLRVSACKGGFSAEHVGGSSDLNAGQLIDRVGVAMGLPFPAGVHIEKLALENKSKIPKRKVSLKGLNLNLSGIENVAAKLFADTEDKSLVSAFLLQYIADALTELAFEYERACGRCDFVFSGGVMCNSIIKSRLSESFNASFAEPMMSADNAVGIAALTRKDIL